MHAHVLHNVYGALARHYEKTYYDDGMKKGLFIALGIIIFAVAGYFLSIIGINNLRAARAIATGHEYLNNVYKDYAIAGEQCQGIDTDGDSYVSCDFRLTKNEMERVVNLQCPTIYKSLIGSSCKESRYPAISQP